MLGKCLRLLITSRERGFVGKHKKVAGSLLLSCALSLGNLELGAHYHPLVHWVWA
jgi:hypothetical protein